MKKVIAIFCLSMIVCSAYDASAQAEIDKGNILLNGGFGFGRYYGGGVPIAVSAEFAINDAISIGPYLAITTWKYAHYYSYTFFDFGARGSYHFNKHLNLNTDKLDLYGTFMLGYTISDYSYDGPFSSYYDDDYDSGVSVGLVAGARWYFTDRFAVNGEVGYGLAPLYIGVTYKL